MFDLLTFCFTFEIIRQCGLMIHINKYRRDIENNEEQMIWKDF